MSLALQEVLKRADIWQASHNKQEKGAISTGYISIDNLLYLNGWPRNKLTEILLSHQNIGEIQLVLPAIERAMKGGGWLFLIEPPFTPYASGWLKYGIDIHRVVIIHSCQEKDWLWASEQIISNGGVACCLFWPPKEHLSNKVLKRLQVAAEKGALMSFIFRSFSVVNQSSPASLRLLVSHRDYQHQKPIRYQSERVISPPINTYLDIEILKQCGGWSGQKLSLRLASH